MVHWIETGGPQYLEDIDATSDGASTKAIDMACEKAVWMFVIAAKHHHLRPVVQQPNERIEVLCGTALADKDLHPRLQFIEGFFGRKTLVIRTDAGGNILFGLVAAQPRGMTVDGFV